MSALRPWVLIQARTGSQRLPGKILADLCGRPLLEWVVERVRRAETIAGTMVLTTTDAGDDDVVVLCDRLAVPVFRGHPTDVLTRYRDAAQTLDPQTPIARVSADSPLLDGAVVDAVAHTFAAGEADLACNHRSPGWPVGTAVEVMSADCLRRLDTGATTPAEREHVTLHAYEHPGRYVIAEVEAPAALRAPELRLCVDTADDLERVRALCASLSGIGAPMSEVVQAGAAA